MVRDLLCFSHLRWDFVYQRPNHLMARAAHEGRVFFVEEPLDAMGSVPHLTQVRRDGVHVVTPRLPVGLPSDVRRRALEALMDGLLRDQRITSPLLWYYTPMALPWTKHLQSAAVVYDCMDYLAGFRGAPTELQELEQQLLDRADLVFCGGTSLHGRLERRHRRSHCFPSSVDLAHFGRARGGMEDPADQRSIPHPRIGYAGVIDERIDLRLIQAVADARPDRHMVLVGPTTKISASDVPVGPNIHLLGMKSYADLPAYLAGWDVGWMPFARNEATRYISPTKTPEYLAAGLPVVSTSIADVIDPYGDEGLVAIADSVAATLRAMDLALAGQRPSARRVDAFLADRSWDRTWAAMSALIEGLDVPDVAATWPATRVARDEMSPAGVPVMAGATAAVATVETT